MTDASDTSFTELIANARKGSVIAAAGCGKTERIALAIKIASGRRLILTHTHAGVDALRQRLKKHGIESNHYHLDTIGGWCLRYAASFPMRSGLAVREPKTNSDWRAIYESTAKLVESGAVNRVLSASYTGVFVDEYQDCGTDQHAMVVALAERLPVCVFGDHLQAIFDFNGQVPVNWTTAVYPTFPKLAQLTKPWRWHKAGNQELANWLVQVRADLDGGRGLNFCNPPSTVMWEWLPDQDGPRRGKIIAACKTAMPLDGRLVVIADPTNLEGRAQIAKSLAKQGFSNIEPIDCKSLFNSAKALDVATDATRLDAAMDFLAKCMIGVAKSEFLKAVMSRRTGGGKGRAQFGGLIELGLRVEKPEGKQHLPELFDGFERTSETHIFRRELFSAMRSGLKSWLAGQNECLFDAVWQVQNRVRHTERRIPRRSVGSTLLVKGLEFEHAIVIHSAKMNRKDWYVALTRATHSVKVLSPQQKFTPPS